MRVLIIDEIHLLGNDRGPVLEVIVSRTNFIASHTHHPVRVVGLSTALANAKDLADWLCIKEVLVYRTLHVCYYLEYNYCCHNQCTFKLLNVDNFRHD